jgi:hypothetical protein
MLNEVPDAVRLRQRSHPYDSALSPSMRQFLKDNPPTPNTWLIEPFFKLAFYLRELSTIQSLSFSASYLLLRAQTLNEWVSTLKTTDQREEPS